MAGYGAVTDVVVHVSPHPDDEAVAAAMTLAALADHGWHVVNLLLSTGRPGDRERRRAEAATAADRAGYELAVVSDDAASRTADCRAAVDTALDRYRPALVLSPQPHDAHPTHERVGAAVRDVIAARAEPPVWWMWGLWAELAAPTLYVPFGESDVARAIAVLECYPGELARNDYRRVLRGRASAQTVLGSERVFGFGTPAAGEAPYAELLTEAVRRDGEWYAGPRRVLDLARPLPDPATATEPVGDRISDRPR